MTQLHLRKESPWKLGEKLGVLLYMRVKLVAEVQLQGLEFETRDGDDGGEDCKLRSEGKGVSLDNSC